MNRSLDIDKTMLEKFCSKWKVSELELFGSVLRGDFGDDSDVDFLVTFASDAHHSLFDRVKMNREMSVLVGRDVDIVSRQAIESSPNWIRRKSILEAAEVYYVAR